MNKRAELGVGTILVAFVGIIVALALYQGIFQYVGDTTGVNVGAAVNSTITLPANGGVLELTGQEYLGDAIITNATGAETVPSTNYTVTERVNTDGLKGIVLTTTVSPYASKSVNISYTYYPDGYIDNSGGRSMANLIPLLSALAIGLFALSIIFKDKLLDMIGK